MDGVGGEEEEAGEGVTQKQTGKTSVFPVLNCIGFRADNQSLK
jgi:hypothetical protein